MRMGANGKTETFLWQKPRAAQVTSRLETPACIKQGTAEAEPNPFSQAS